MLTQCYWQYYSRSLALIYLVIHVTGPRDLLKVPNPVCNAVFHYGRIRWQQVQSPFDWIYALVIVQRFLAFQCNRCVSISTHPLGWC